MDHEFHVRVPTLRRYVVYGAPGKRGGIRLMAYPVRSGEQAEPPEDALAPMFILATRAHDARLLWRAKMREESEPEVVRVCSRCFGIVRPDLMHYCWEYQ